MGKRRVDELLSVIVALTPVDRQRLIAELTKGAILPGSSGRKPLRKTAPKAVAPAKRLNGRGLSLRRIAAKLAEAGLLNKKEGSPTMRRASARCCGGRRKERGPGASRGALHAVSSSRCSGLVLPTAVCLGTR